MISSEGYSAISLVVLIRETGLPAKFPHTSLCMQVIVNENNGKNNATAMGLCAVFVVSWWRNKRLHTLNRVHKVWGCAEI